MKTRRNDRKQTAHRHPHFENLESRLLLSGDPVLGAFQVTPAAPDEGQSVDLTVSFTDDSGTETWSAPAAVTGLVDPTLHELTPYIASDGMYLVYNGVMSFAANGATPGSFEAPVALTGIGDSGSIQSPWVGDNGFTGTDGGTYTARMYYYYGSGATRELRVAVRDTTGAWINQFAPVTNNQALAEANKLVNINLLGDVAHPTLTADELNIVFAGLDLTVGGTTYSGWNLFEASRATTDDAFANITALSSVNALTGDKLYSGLSGDGLDLYFTLGNQQIMQSSRASRSDPFDTPVMLTGIGAGSVVGPALAADGQSLYMSRMDTGSTWGVFRSTLGTSGGTETHSAAIDWDGDGQVDETVADVDSPFQVSHTYADDGTYAVTVTVTDSSGNSGSRTESLSVNNVAPTVAITGVPAAVNEGDVVTLSSHVTDPGVLDTHTYAWSVTKAGVTVAAGAGTDLTFTPADNGDYEVVLTVTDKDGGVGTDSLTLTVGNVAPTLGLSLDQVAIFEGGSVTLTGTVADPGSADTHTVDIAWGDGQQSLGVVVDPVSRTFQVDHSYADDTPSGTAGDPLTIVATVTDKDGDSDTEVTTVTVQNVAPVLVAVSSDATWADDVAAGQAVTLTGQFTDAGLLDSHSVTVDWGDGSTGTAAVDAVAGSFSGTHVYAAGGLYTVTATVQDDDTGVDAGVTAVVQTGVGVQDGVLNIVGSSASEKITVRPDSADPAALVVRVRQKGSSTTQTYVISEPVTRIDAYGRAGSDMISVSHGVTLDTVLDGGDDADLIWGGAGDDRILGGGGDDKLFGRAGNDTIDGGLGNDRLWGNHGDDILLGGDGIDKISGGRGLDTIDGGAGNDILWGRADDDIIVGGAGDDVLVGGGGDDNLSGGDGDDWLDGGSGNDVIVGGDGNDVILGGAGDDMLLGEGGDDLIFGGSGADTIDGGNGDDLIFGGPGADTIDGGSGFDLVIDGWQWCWD